MSWRRILKSRDFHAAWIGAVLVGLAMYFDVVWVWGLVVVGLVTAFLIVRWVVLLSKPERWPED